MKRLNITELHEQPWLPQFLRDGVTDALQAALSFGQVYRPISPLLAHAIRTSCSGTVIDLCSGGGGPWMWLRDLVAERGSDLEICLTDKFPNLPAFESASHAALDRIVFSRESVDATNIPSDLHGFRTVFSSFHHFTPQDAAAILQNAVEHREGIAVFEAARRRPGSLLLTFLMPVASLLAVPLVRPFRLSLLFWTYLVPLIPFVLWFDGVLSCLRAYSPDELSQFVSALPPNDFTWEIGEKRGWFSPVTYLIGYPSACSSAASRAAAAAVHSAA